MAAETASVLDLQSQSFASLKSVNVHLKDWNENSFKEYSRYYVKRGAANDENLFGRFNANRQWNRSFGITYPREYSTDMITQFSLLCQKKSTTDENICKDREKVICGQLPATKAEIMNGKLYFRFACKMPRFWINYG